MEIIALGIPFLAYILMDKFFDWLKNRFGIDFSFDEPKRTGKSPQQPPLRGTDQWQ